MKANELRIGNWYKGDCLAQQYWQITAQEILDFYDDPIDDYFQPILLSEHWLEKLGFKKNNKNRWVKEKSNYAVFYREYYATGEDNSMWRIEYHDTDYGNNEYKDCHQFGDKIKYVHQLQNLYFALTQEEL